MSVRTRCSECRKKISVDEAFAGSMCRCPYCKSIVIVPRSLGAGPSNAARRPSRPNAPGPSMRPKAPAAGRPSSSGLRETVGSRPILSGDQAEAPKAVGPTRIEEPGKPRIPTEPKREPAPAPAAGNQTLPVDEKQLTREELARIPTANPVLIQGLTSLALIVVLLIMVGATIYLGVLIFGPQPNDAGVPTASEEELTTAYLGEQTNPFRPAGKPMMAADIPVTAPVAYVIDGGSRMGTNFPFAVAMSLASAKSLGGAQGGLIIAGDPDATLLGGAMKPAGELDALAEELDLYAPSGASDLPKAIELALDRGAKTVVLILNGKSLDEPAKIGKPVADAGAKLVLIGMMPIDDMQRDEWQQAVDAAGNGAVLRVYDESRYLIEWFEELQED